MPKPHKPKQHRKKNRPDSFVAKTLFGLEEILAKELEQIGAKNINILRRAVSFDGDDELMYKANLYCRTALRILKIVFQFRAKNEEELYKGMYSIYWDKYILLQDTFAIDAVTSSEIFRHSKYAALKTKDAIADQFMSRRRRRPSVDVRHPNVRINVHIFDTRVTVALDSSGSSLHLRNYRQGQPPAPLNEVLAAGMLMLAGWKGDTDFVDPMCGSGTLLAEAAMIAQNIAPGALRRHYGFEGWKEFDKPLWERIKKEERDNRKEATCKIFGYDKSHMAIRQSKDNLFSREFSMIRLKKTAIEDLDSPFKDGGTMMFNPPYGERLDMEETFYTMIGDTLKQKFTGYDVWIISSNLEALKKVGLKATNKHNLLNGALECKFLCYQMYEGSKREKEEKKDKQKVENKDESV